MSVRSKLKFSPANFSVLGTGGLTTVENSVVLFGAVEPAVDAHMAMVAVKAATVRDMWMMFCFISVITRCRISLFAFCLVVIDGKAGSVAARAVFFIFYYVDVARFFVFFPVGATCFDYVVIYPRRHEFPFISAIPSL